MLIIVFYWQILSYFIFESIVVYFFSDPKRRDILPIKAEPSLLLFGLGKDVVPSLIKVALKKQVRFLFLTCLSNKF